MSQLRQRLFLPMMVKDQHVLGCGAVVATDDDLVQILERLGFIEPGGQARMQALTGGVSSDIWKVETPARTLCVKRALAKLKVKADWRAPIERNAYEAAWMREAAGVVPNAVPELLGEDRDSGLLVMAYLAPEHYLNWKDELRQGRADPAVAQAVGGYLARIHAATANRSEIEERFPTDNIFYDIRLEPYLMAPARAYPELAAFLERLVERTKSTKLALVHGDVSPKNILVGPTNDPAREAGPFFLDAECAWYGDPAFDLAFCLNHLLLKGAWVSEAKPAFLACYDALARCYLDGITWEKPDGLEARAASLLPGLLLGRIDGKSPVEYISDERQKDRIRHFASKHLRMPPKGLSAIRDAWAIHPTTSDQMPTAGGET